MKSKTMTTLVILFGLLLALYVLRQSNWFNPSPPPADGAKPLPFTGQFGIPKMLTITWPDGRKICMDLKDGAWQIVEPISAQADQGKVAALVKTVSDLKYARSFNPAGKGGVPDNLSGLDNSAMALTLTDAGGIERTVMVGRKMPMIGSNKVETYIRPKGDNLTYIVAEDLNAQFDQNVLAFRNKKIVPLRSDDIVAVEIKGADKCELRKIAGQWQLATRDFTAEADEMAVFRYLSTIVDLQATDFLSRLPAGAKLDPPVMTMAVYASKTVMPPGATGPSTVPAAVSREIELAFSPKLDDKVYVRVGREPSVYVIQAAAFDKLAPDIAALRDKSVLRLAYDDVVKIGMELPSGKAELVRRDGRWFMAAPFAGPASEMNVEEFAARLRSLSAETWEDSQSASLWQHGLDKPRAAITIDIAGRTEPKKLLIGSTSASGEMTFVKSASSKNIASVKSADVQVLLKEPARFWSPEIFNLPQGQEIDRVSLTRPEEQGPVELVRESEGSWIVSGMKPGQFEQEPIKKILRALSELNANVVVSLGSVPPAYKSAPDIITVNFSTVAAGGAQTAASLPAKHTHTLRVAKAGAANCLAWLEGAEPVVVGEFPAGLYETLAEDFRSRDVLAIDPAGVVRIKLLGAGKVDELVKVAGDWQSAKDPNILIKNDAVGDFLKAFKAVRAERFFRPDYKPVGLESIRQMVEKDPWFMVQLTDKDGKTAQIIVGNAGVDKTVNRYAIISGIDLICLINTSQLTPMAKNIEDFKKK
ncbi:MAG: DUF4340 domain-containing protein [Planctomycetes bacterium]|nr:DUF4340 domain-containing protein [Planctomycetota bacterium]